MTKLSPDQQAATDAFLKFIAGPKSGAMAIKGFAGVGKSFLTKHLIEAAKKTNQLSSIITQKQSNDLNIEYTATTNKAAHVLGNMVGDHATTIHSLLNLKVFNNYSNGKTSIRKTKDFVSIQKSLIIIDEASMVSKELYKIITESCKTCKVLYILDPYQLAPIGESDCIVDKKVKNAHSLTTIHRYDSEIAELADGFRKVIDGGEFPKIVDNGKNILRVSGDKFKEMINQEFLDASHNPNKAKILAWTNETVHGYNNHVRSLYTTDSKYIPGEYVVTNKPLEGTKGKLISTDSIIRIDTISDEPVNRFGVSCWYITSGETSIYQPVYFNEYTKKLKVIYKAAKDPSNKSINWIDYFNLKEKIADLRPVHASTVHKSQGSTHDTVFINLNDIGRNINPTEVARLMYVAITRASQKVVLYGKLGIQYNDG